MDTSVGWRNLLRGGVVVLVLAAATATAALAGSVDVKLELPMPARVDLAGRESVLAAPFIVVSQEGEGRLRDANIDVRAEFERYLQKVLRRETKLRIIESEPLDYPTYDLEALSREQDFWRAVGERTQADLILVGSLDFDVQDRSGYKTEEYVSPLNGQVYYRQVLVEQTGFEYDIVVQVYDGKTGELLFTDNFKDFKALEGDQADPLRGMFENLYALEDKLVGIFAQKSVTATRTLLN